MADDFSELDDMAQGYEPSTGQTPGPEVLPEGMYKVRIKRAELIKTPKTGDSIFRMMLQVIEGPYDGTTFERPQFLKSPVQLNMLGGDFCKLGIDAKEWGKGGKSWSLCLRENQSKLVGKQFMGQRKDGKEQDDGRPGFPNFNVVSAVNAGVSYEPPESTKPMPASDIPF